MIRHIPTAMRAAHLSDEALRLLARTRQAIRPLPRPVLTFIFCFTVLWLGCGSTSAAIQLAKSGKAFGPIHLIRAAQDRPPTPVEPGVWLDLQSRVDPAIADLARCLQQMTGAVFEIKEINQAPGDDAAPGIYIGHHAILGLPPVDGSGPEGFTIKTVPDQVLIAADTELGLSHAIYTLLDALGCRWYFPGDQWEVIPHHPDAAVELHTRQRPAFDLERCLIFGHAQRPRPKSPRDIADWNRRNRVGFQQVSLSHRWPGIDPQSDFTDHPEWFALCPDSQGQHVRQPTKPCYSHPEVIQRGVRYALDYFAQHPDARMISVSPPDGLGFCECERCLGHAGAIQTYRVYPGLLMGKNERGQDISIASQTVFEFTNQVARAVSERFPGKRVGVLAYSAHSHPPTFDLEPNVTLGLAMAYRRTTLTGEALLEAQRRRATQQAVYEYFSVLAWSKDRPGESRAANLDYLQAAIRYYHDRGIRGLQAEATKSFAPNGIGYYVAARLLWDVNADARAIEQRFYREAFGPAADSIRRIYQRWESGERLNDRTWLLTAGDLQEAADRTAPDSIHRRRVDLLRRYAHFLFLQMPFGQFHPQQAERWVAAWGEAEARARLDRFGATVGSLADTYLIDSWGWSLLAHKARAALEIDVEPWRRPAAKSDPGQIEALLAQDMAAITPATAAGGDIRLFARHLVPVTASGSSIDASPAVWFDSASFYVPAEQGQSVEFALSPDGQHGTCLVSYLSAEAFEAQQTATPRRTVTPAASDRLSFQAERTGYYCIDLSGVRVLSINRPAVMPGGGFEYDGGRLFFYVPKRTRQFVITSKSRGPLEPQVLDQRGRSVPTVGGDAQTGWVVAVPDESEGGIWSIQLPRSVGVRTALGLIGVPSYFALNPATLLTPCDALKPSPEQRSQPSME